MAAAELPDPTSVLSTDGQVLMPVLTVKEFPERPEDPAALPEDDAGRYYDMEYAGWDAESKVNIPASPADGPEGKKVILIVHGDHPWTTAYINGAKKACEFFGMELEAWSPNWDVNVQNQLIDQAINARPDAIGLIPLNAESAVQQFRKINEAGIPVFGTNTLPTSDAMKYMISWTGRTTGARCACWPTGWPTPWATRAACATSPTTPAPRPTSPAPTARSLSSRRSRRTSRPRHPDARL
jgi:ribose transport system substrate-binding protein